MKKIDKLNAEIWKTHGLVPEAWWLADKTMKRMLAVLDEISPELATVVFSEALFQLHTLPTRTAKFQQEHRWIDPTE